MNANDTTGNLAIATYSFYTDEQGPTITLVSPGNSSLVPASTLIDLNVTDPAGIDHVDYAWDTDSNGTLAPPYDEYLPAAPGTHTLHVYAYDNFGNMSEFTAVFSVDTVPVAQFYVNTVIIYAMNGLLCGFAGIIMASRLSTGQPTAGTAYELDVIAACVIGGASLSGGQGTIVGAMIGALIMGVLRNGCNLLDISAFWQQIAIGTIIIVAVFSDQYRKHKRG